MIDWALDVAKHEGWPEENVHYERFSTPPPGKPFEIEVKSTGERITAGDHQSALEALEQAGVDAPYLCCGGARGQCITGVIDSTGALVYDDQSRGITRQRSTGYPNTMTASRPHKDS
jgi:ferredoxin